MSDKPFVNMSVSLEDLIDVYGLEHVLDCISTICEEKAEHIKTNWPESLDEALKWKRCGRVVNTAANRKVIGRTSPARS